MSLTPRARREVALRTIADGLVDLVAAVLEETASAGEWVDQARSPLGRRRHLEAVRRGEIPGRRDGRRVLVRKSDLDKFLEAHPAATKIAAPPANDDDDTLEAVIRDAGIRPAPPHKRRSA